MKAIVTVLGKDQVGIIAAVCTLLADNNVNVWTSARPSCGSFSP